MLTGALLILAPLFLGFAIALENRRAMTVIHYTVEGLVYFILLLLGLGLGQMEGLAAQLGGMAAQVIALVLVLLSPTCSGYGCFTAGSQCRLSGLKVVSALATAGFSLPA